MKGRRPIRKTLQRFERERGGRFLTFSTRDRRPFLGHPKIRDLVVTQLMHARSLLRFRLHGFVVMPEHVHLLITPDLEAATVPRILNALKSPVAKTVVARWRELNAAVLAELVDPRGVARFWQPGGGYDRNIWSRDEYFEKLGYIQANPVKRGLCARETDWAWSSARWYAGLKDEGVVIDPETW